MYKKWSDGRTKFHYAYFLHKINLISDLISDSNKFYFSFTPKLRILQLKCIETKLFYIFKGKT